MQAGRKAEATVIVERNGHGWEAMAGVVGFMTMRRGEGPTRTAALMSLESHMDTVESYESNDTLQGSPEAKRKEIP
jgi:hypothetical protein